MYFYLAGVPFSSPHVVSQLTVDRDQSYGNAVWGGFEAAPFWTR